MTTNKRKTHDEVDDNEVIHDIETQRPIKRMKINPCPCVSTSSSSSQVALEEDEYFYDLTHEVDLSLQVIKKLSGSSRSSSKQVSVPLSCCVKKILVLDLDETMVLNKHGKSHHADFNYQVFHEGSVYDFNCRLRPYLYEFLEEVSKDWLLITWTASIQKVAEPLINFIDPARKYLSHVLYRDSCLDLSGAYLKDLQVFGRDMKDVVILDNNPLTFSINPSNGVPITSWNGDSGDDALKVILPFLRKLSYAEDVRPIIDARFGFSELIYSSTIAVGDVIQDTQ